MISVMIGIASPVASMLFFEYGLHFEAPIIVLAALAGISGIVALCAGVAAQRNGITRDEREWWFKALAAIAAGVTTLCIEGAVGLTMIVIKLLAVSGH